jgi:hypothetical protein
VLRAEDPDVQRFDFELEYQSPSRSLDRMDDLPSCRPGCKLTMNHSRRLTARFIAMPT